MLDPSRISVLDCNHRLGAMPYGRIAQPDADQDLYGEAAHERRLGFMRDLGVDAALIMPVWYYLKPNGVVDTRAVNDRLAKYRDRDLEHIPAALGLAEPLHGEAGLEEIHRLHEELGFVGIFYANTWQGVPASDPWMYRHFELLLELKMFPILHMPAESMAVTPSMVAGLATEFPELPILMVDGWSGIVQYGQLLSDAMRIPNLYFDTVGPMAAEMLATFVTAVGPERLLFGSDTYSHRCYAKFGPDMIAQLLGPEAAPLVLRDNLVRLLEWTGKPIFAS